MSNLESGIKNRVRVVGRVHQEPQFSHKSHGESFYRTFLKVDRLSENHDLVPILVSDRQLSYIGDLEGKLVEVEGQFRSGKHIRNDGSVEYQVSVFVQKMFLVDEGEYSNIPREDRIIDGNTIHLVGKFARTPNYRKMRTGREVCDILVMVERSYGKVDYLPCIVWGRNARYVSRLQIGSEVSLQGRVQSREYKKKVDGDIWESRMTYEVSVNQFEVIRGDTKVGGMSGEDRDSSGTV